MRRAVLKACGSVKSPGASRFASAGTRCSKHTTSVQADDDFEEAESWSEGPKPLSEEERTAFIREIVRANILSEVAAARLAMAQRCSQQERPDLSFRQEREEQLLRNSEALASKYRTRPSLLRPLASAVGLSLGAAATLLPKQASGAITGAVQEALTERYNDQLRELREAGLSDSEEPLRELLRELRDEERAPVDAVQAPDLLKLQRPQELSAPEILAGVVKYGLKGLFSLGSKI